jgi:type IV fimbrial biogenesis protein FimT
MKGFTLIELMVTLTIGVVLLVVAVPNLTAYRRNAELASISNTLLATINAARGEALKRGMRAMVVPVDGAHWNSGWMVFVDTDYNSVYGPGDIAVTTHGSIAGKILVTGTQVASGAKPYFLFDASGFSKTLAGGFGAGSIRLERLDADPATAFEETRLIKVAPTGRVRACRPESFADANCSTNLED